MKSILKAVHIFILMIYFSPTLLAQTPSWLWANSAGGGIVYDIATDSYGNVYATGYYTDSIMSFGTLSIASEGEDEGFIAKYDPSGNLLWAKSFGGKNQDRGTSITTDYLGNVILSGFFHSDTLIIGGNSFFYSLGASDIFVAKFNTSGNLLWARAYGSQSVDVNNSVVTDRQGNVFIAGSFAGTSISFGTTSLINSGVVGYDDLFIAKLNSSGNELWAISQGNSIGGEVAKQLAVDSIGNLFVAGAFNGNSTSLGSYNFNNSHSGLNDLFIEKLSPAGNQIWAKSAGSIDEDYCQGICVDSSGNIIIAGGFRNANLSLDTISLLNSGGNDVFIAKYDQSGNIIWAKTIGATGNEFCENVAFDRVGNAYLTGTFNDPTLTIGSNTFPGTFHFYIAHFDLAGNVVWATTTGTNGPIGPRGITVDDAGSVILAGSLPSNTTFFGTIPLVHWGITNIFVSKFNLQTGINDIRNTSPILLYPNPSKNQLTVLCNSEAKQVIQVFDISGKIRFSQQLWTGGSNSLNIDVSEWKQGLYFVNIEKSDGNNTSTFFIKE